MVLSAVVPANVLRSLVIAFAAVAKLIGVEVPGERVYARPVVSICKSVICKISQFLMPLKTHNMGVY